MIERCSVWLADPYAPPSTPGYCLLTVRQKLVFLSLQLLHEPQLMLNGTLIQSPTFSSVTSLPTSTISPVIS